MVAPRPWRLGLCAPRARTSALTASTARRMTPRVTPASTGYPGVAVPTRSSRAGSRPTASRAATLPPRCPPMPSETRSRPPSRATNAASWFSARARPRSLATATRTAGGAAAPPAPPAPPSRILVPPPVMVPRPACSAKRESPGTARAPWRRGPDLMIDLLRSLRGDRGETRRPWSTLCRGERWPRDGAAARSTLRRGARPRGRAARGLARTPRSEFVAPGAPSRRPQRGCLAGRGGLGARREQATIRGRRAGSGRRSARALSSSRLVRRAAACRAGFPAPAAPTAAGPAHTR